MVPFNNRFHGHSSLNFVYKNGQNYRSRFFTLKTVKNPRRKRVRLAVVISKKVLKSAVRRNRIRRRLYEYLRYKIPKIEANYDIVLIVSSAEIYNLPYDQLVVQLNQLFDQANI